MQNSVPFDDITPREAPLPITIAIAVDAHGRANPITLAWCMRTSLTPPLYAISIGQTRYSLEALRHSRAFVLCFPSAAMAEAARIFGTQSGREIDKLTVARLATTPATRVPGVLLADAAANIECEVVSEHPTGDHVIFVGQVLAAHVNADATVGRLFALAGERMGGVTPA
jgi:flavin reductase (DIM6/NTAB) family NADH-FMN oxidoreductase RutF